MTGAKVALWGAISSSMLPVGQVDLGSLVDVIKTTGVTGCLVVALVYLVRDGTKRQLRMEKLLADASRAIAEQAAATRTANAILEDFRVTIEKCKAAQEAATEG